jgi:hypothetical protein
MEAEHRRSCKHSGDRGPSGDLLIHHLLLLDIDIEIHPALPAGADPSATIALACAACA